MLNYYAFKIAQATLAYFPETIGYLIARVVADLVYLLSPATRNAVSVNMRHALGPDADPASVRRAARGVVRNVAKSYFDLIRLPRMNLHDIEGRVELHGFEHLEEALKRGKGVILATAHLGSFDVASQVLAVKSVKTTILVEPLEPPQLLDHVISLRASLGLNYAPAQLGALRGLIRCLHRGEAILLTCDRDFTDEGLIIDFFGEKTSLPVGAVRIAMRTGAALVPAFNLRRPDGRHDIFWEPAIDMAPAGDGAVEKNVSQIIRVIERYIRKDPEQWVVLSPIWKDAKTSIVEDAVRQRDGRTEGAGN